MTQPSANKDCRECFFYMSPREATTYLGGTTNAPLCGKYNKLLAVPNNPDKSRNLRKKLANNCPSYTREFSSTIAQKADNKKAEHVFKFALPMMLDPLLSQNQPENVGTCRACEFYIPESESVERFGISIGACAKKGQFVSTHKLTTIAAACNEKSFGPTSYSFSDLMILPEYAEAFGGLGAMLPSMSNSDPLSHPTDAPVTDEDKAVGILAWRKITNPEDSDLSVLLPIYNPDFFEENERKKIPQTNDDEHPEDYLDHNGAVYQIAAIWRELDDTPGVWGEAGTGKTELFRHMAWLMQLPFERFSINGGSELDDLAGKMHYTEGVGTHFKHGRLPLAWKRPCVLCIDEPNVGPNEVWQFLRPLTDNSKQLVLDMNEGERIERHDHAYLGMAMNPAWDPRNIGANPISDADSSRLMHVFMDLPPDELEKKILEKACERDGWKIKSVDLHRVMQSATAIRSLSEEGDITITWGLRHQIKVVRALRWFGPIKAYQLAAGNAMEPAEQAKLMNAVRPHFPSI